ncbi:hypothetical protein GCM10010315_23790 [Streptomyces luteosporeus]|uniref:Type II toxin-antitoxin system RelE/ParE family toxin n=1 Tax=Streptomyces luteosporeus TaxID=173856 RepID=A0ABP6G8G4_9ACTN
MSDGDDLWPVSVSPLVAEALADPVLPAELFSKICALTVAIAENPWLEGSSQAAQGGDWRTALIPDGRGIVEYLVKKEEQQVVLTRIFPF